MSPKSLEFSVDQDWRGALAEFSLPRRDLWVFGYGSLMWNPGFKVHQSRSGRIHGYHRKLCLWSIKYRGTPQQPGLILGLDRGGSCRGIAFKVPNEDIETTAAYLFKREMVTNLYRPTMVTVRLEDNITVSALTFVVKRDHPQYAGHFPLERQFEIVHRATGPRGSNSDYVLSTCEMLNGLGISDTDLHRLSTRLGDISPKSGQ